MRRLRETAVGNKDLVGILIAVASLVVAIVALSSPAKFLVGGVLGICVLVVLHLLGCIKLVKAAVLSSLMLVFSVGGYFVSKEIAESSVKPKLERFSVEPSSGYTNLIDNGLVYVQRLDQDADSFILNIGLSNPSDDAIYIKGVTFELLAFQDKYKRVRDSRVRIHRITVTFRKKPTSSELSAFCTKYQLSVVDEFQDMVMFSTNPRFSRSDLRTLKQDSLVARAEATILGEGFADIKPSSMVQVKERITPAVKQTFTATDKSIPSHGLELFPVSMKFSGVGAYSLRGWISYGSDKLQLPKFIVVVDR